MRTLPLCLALLATPALLPAQSLLILSKHDHTLSIVDPGSLKVVATAPVGNDPHEVIASTDGRLAYVSNYGFGAYNTLAVVDLTSHQAMPSIDLGPLRGPHGLAYAVGKLYFTAETEKVIARYDPASQKVDWILGTGQNRTHMLNVNPDQQRIVTTNVNSGTVSLIEQEPVRMPPPPPGAKPPTASLPGPATDWNEHVIRVGNGSEGFDLSPDQKEIWVANAQDSTISIINIAAKAVIATIPSNAAGANRLKFAQDGAHVLVSSRDGLTIFDAPTRTEIKRLPIGKGCAGILIEPAGHRAFVACSQSGTVSVIDLTTFEVAGTIDAGPEPDGMAWATRP